MTKTFERKLKSINAVVVSYDTGEKWVDKNGKQYNIERKPINWGVIRRQEIGETNYAK